jgi:hypothetical protein
MRLICKSNFDTLSHNILYITVGKSYSIIQEDNFGYQLTDDEGRNFWYNKDLFYTLQETRDITLNSIVEEKVCHICLSDDIFISENEPLICDRCEQYYCYDCSYTYTIHYQYEGLQCYHSSRSSKKNSFR